MSAYPKMLDEENKNITEDERQNRIKKNKIAYFMQQRGNLGIKELYDGLVQNKEQAVLDLVSEMEASGKTEEEIISELGIDLKRYKEFSEKISAEKKSLNDEIKAVLIADRLLQGKSSAEICEELCIDKEEYARIYREDKGSRGIIDTSLKDKTLVSSNIEKRKLDEIISGKSTLEMYVEYEMLLEELEGTSEQIERTGIIEETIEKQEGVEEETIEVVEETEDRTKGELEALAAQCDQEVSLEERKAGMEVTQDLKNEDMIREEGQQQKGEGQEL